MNMIISPMAEMARRHPGLTGVIESGRSLSYARLYQHIQALARQLQRAGFEPGDRLACISANSLQMLLLYWACVETRVLFFPISPRFPPAQLGELLGEYRIGHYWSPQPLELASGRPMAFDFDLRLSAEATPLDADAAVSVVLTSGSSGVPKAAVHSLGNHLASAQGSTRLIPLNDKDAWLLSLPLFHIGGLAILHRCALAGAAVVLTDPGLDLAQQLVRDKISHLSLVETQLQRLLRDAPASLKHVRALLLGGGAISAASRRALASADISAFSSYGMTEMSSQITTGPICDDGSSGTLLPGRELSIAGGMIRVRGETLFQGYLPRASDACGASLQLPLDRDGWFCTRDRGEWNTAARLCVLGRADNMFICGGENVQPEEIEAALKSHPQIGEAIVFGRADAEFGQLPAAIIRLHDASADLPGQAQLDAFLADRIARFKRPRRYYPWPDDVDAPGLKLPRKRVIAAIDGR